MELVAVFSKQVKRRDTDKKKDSKSKNDQNNQVTLEDYEKIKVIGKGGFAEKVYLARKKDTGSLYAIKTMSKKFILEEQGRYEQVFGELKVM